MARVLIVGCGCRGRSLATALADEGHPVRGTSRDEAGRAAIESAGFDGAVADPDRLGTLLGCLEGVSAAVWLLGSARGERRHLADLHGPRLETMLERLVDTPVRGLVYEAAGSVPDDLMVVGAATVRRAQATWSMPVAVVNEDPADAPGWIAAMTAAVGLLLSIEIP